MAVDSDLRQRMRRELDDLLKRIDIPVLIITHDSDDLYWCGDEALYLRSGEIADRPLSSEQLPRQRTTVA